MEVALSTFVVTGVDDVAVEDVEGADVPAETLPQLAANSAKANSESFLVESSLSSGLRTNCIISHKPSFVIKASNTRGGTGKAEFLLLPTAHLNQYICSPRTDAGKCCK